MRNKTKIIIIVSVILLSTFQLLAKNDVQKIEINENSQQKASPWWSSNIVNLLGILIGACLILLQLWLQHRNSMKLQAEDYRNKYHLEIYKEFSELTNKAMKDSGKVLSEMVNLEQVFLVNLKRDVSRHELYPEEVKEIFQLTDSFFNSQSIITDIIFLIEKYEIVIPKFRIFITAFNSVTIDSQLSVIELRDLLLTLVPFDDEKIKKIENSLNCVNNLISTQIGYLYDLQNELQNKLLNKLFKNKVLKRIPNDLSHKVITTDSPQLENLKKYFIDKKGK